VQYGIGSAVLNNVGVIGDAVLGYVQYGVGNAGLNNAQNVNVNAVLNDQRYVAVRAVLTTCSIASAAGG